MDIKEFKRLISGMAEQLAHQLRQERSLSAMVVLNIRYANFDTETK